MFSFRIEKPGEPTIVRSTSPWMEGRFAGSVDAVAEHLERYRRVGQEYALCAFESEDVEHLLRQMRVLAEKLIPQFTEA
jgi:hypothetical protein